MKQIQLAHLYTNGSFYGKEGKGVVIPPAKCFENHPPPFILTLTRFF